MTTLEPFDFRFQPSIPVATIKQLAELGFLDRAENIVLVGASGRGQTHLAMALGLKASTYTSGQSSDLILL
ncbi:MAG TPA: ATP-binding protein [Firmicutes bacterium]|nr:ATP-binding protein [Bacillota bacterium]